jgi:hypothetical protein
MCVAWVVGLGWEEMHKLHRLQQHDEVWALGSYPIDCSLDAGVRSESVWRTNEAPFCVCSFG